MKLNIYVIHDQKAESYMQPFYQVNHAVAVRSVAASFRDPNSAIASNPEDFTLFCVGTYDDGTGSFEISETKEVVTQLHELQTQLEI